MSFGAKVWDASSNVLFDSTAENTLFYVNDYTISGAAVLSAGSVTYSYPTLTGMKIAAFLQSPFIGSGYGEPVSLNPTVLSCRVTYPAGVPTVTITGDGGAEAANGHLTVFQTGAAQ